jgi:hypothetical protein
MKFLAHPEIIGLNSPRTSSEQTGLSTPPGILPFSSKVSSLEKGRAASRQKRPGLTDAGAVLLHNIDSLVHRGHNESWQIQSHDGRTTPVRKDPSIGRMRTIEKELNLTHVFEGTVVIATGSAPSGGFIA